jgi:cupin fold WbuC family metalloprotein
MQPIKKNILKTNVLPISSNDCLNLVNSTQKSLLKRSRICAHKDNEDLIHEMIIHFSKDSYIRPHKHINKTESYLILEGEVDLIYFNDDGKIIESHSLFSYKNAKENQNFYIRTSNMLFHTLYIKSDYLLMLEITNGPFNKKESIFAEWAPTQEKEEEIKYFLNSLKKLYE